PEGRNPAAKVRPVARLSTSADRIEEVAVFMRRTSSIQDPENPCRACALCSYYSGSQTGRVAQGYRGLPCGVVKRVAGAPGAYIKFNSDPTLAADFKRLHERAFRPRRGSHSACHRGCEYGIRGRTGTAQWSTIMLSAGFRGTPAGVSGVGSCSQRPVETIGYDSRLRSEEHTSELQSREN